MSVKDSTFRGGGGVSIGDIGLLSMGLSGRHTGLFVVGLCNLSHDHGIYWVAPYLSIQACIWLTCL
jgi:hypothetical protein